MKEMIERAFEFAKDQAVAAMTNGGDPEVGACGGNTKLEIKICVDREYVGVIQNAEHMWSFNKRKERT